MERGLNLASQCLALLRPSPVSIRFFASAAVDTDRMQALGEQLLVASSMEAAEGQPRRGAVWGIKATLGQALRLTMQASADPLAAEQVSDTSTASVGIAGAL